MGGHCTRRSTVGQKIKWFGHATATVGVVRRSNTSGDRGPTFLGREVRITWMRERGLVGCGVLSGTLTSRVTLARDSRGYCGSSASPTFDGGASTDRASAAFWGREVRITWMRERGLVGCGVLSGTLTSRVKLGRDSRGYCGSSAYPTFEGEAALVGGWCLPKTSGGGTGCAEPA